MPRSPESRRRLASGCSLEVLSEGHGVVRGHLCTAREDRSIAPSKPETTDGSRRPSPSTHLAEVRRSQTAPRSDRKSRSRSAGEESFTATFGSEYCGRVREIVPSFALIGCRNVADDDVVAVSVHAGDQRTQGVSVNSAVTPRSQRPGR